ncbi:T9SS type A sorting domain-containing protein [bacterium]|nr:T9SS type A sorting domain-containing protein [bacterium]
MRGVPAMPGILFVSLSLAFLFITPAQAERVTSGLVVLYTFEENSGDIIHDTSGVMPALDLIDNTPTATSWIVGGLSVNTCTVIASTQAATKLYTACTASNEISLEAWVNPQNITQEGPARIMTFSLDGGARNFTLGQNESQVAFRLRTTDTNNNGVPTFYSNLGALSANLTHIVCTRDNTGAVTIYVDSVSVSTTSISGNFSNWNNSYQFASANELSLDDRRWFGDLHLVAVYSRALSAPEVLQNFTHSADATPTVTQTATQTATPLGTHTDTPTQTVSPTRTISPTATPSGTCTPTATITPSPTISATITVTATHSPTRTHTPDVTATHTSTRTIHAIKSIFPYPQPATDDTLYFYFQIDEPANITIEIMNLVGEKIKTITLARNTAGEFRHTWDIAAVAPGIYFYRVTLNYPTGKIEKRDFEKIVIVKR